MTTRKIQQIIDSVPASDGAGVRLRRSLGSANHLRADPFLMLDEFSSEDPDDYVAAFPSHPHRGFETVTYLLDGHMLHEDHLGNRGNLKSGGVQWMTAGADGARFLLLAARPLKEPVVQYGPFVMNTRAEIEQAIRDYQNGVLAV